MCIFNFDLGLRLTGVLTFGPKPGAFDKDYSESASLVNLGPINDTYIYIYDGLYMYMICLCIHIYMYVCTCTMIYIYICIYTYHTRKSYTSIG